MFSMTVAAMRRRRIAAAAALAAALIAPAAARRSCPGGAGLGVPSRPHRRLRRQPGRQRGAELGRRARERLLVLLRRVQLRPGL